MSEVKSTEPDAPAKPRAAASLTADIVARGRHRTQDYGEAGLWRGPKAPPPGEAPVRVAFPRAHEYVEEVPEASGSAEEATIVSDPATGETDTEERAPEASGPLEELGSLLLVCAGVFFAVFFLGLLLF